MNLEEYRLACGWSKKEMARRADMDFNTLQKALNGESIAMKTANKLAHAISRELGQSVQWQQIDGLNVRL
jgi:transcriptional regulator with XRE-family HTH domain